MSELLIGVDIGGTKCAVSLGRVDGDQITILDKRRFPTPATPQATLDLFAEHLTDMKGDQAVTAIGISCGGPLDSQRGVVLEPPNLPGWINIPVVEFFEERFHIPTALQNDANAGALSEWLWGAGRGLDNLIFLTFGTGMGAGLILNGQLYSGTNDMGGEVGHIRLADDGPVGFGKAGSFEGFCSGGGIARLAASRAEDAIRAGNPPAFAPSLADLPDISTRTVSEAANAGDPLALEIFDTVARRLGQGLALLIDILNPQRIILGSIYLRQRHLLEEAMWGVLREEVIRYSLSVVDIMPPGLGEAIGDYAAFAVARYGQK